MTGTTSRNALVVMTPATAKVAGPYSSLGVRDTTLRATYEGNFRMSIFDFLLMDEPAPPGKLIDHARKTDSLLAKFNRLPDIKTPEAETLLSHISHRRRALSQSRPATSLDLLILCFTASQAAHLLRTIDVDTLDESKLRYWATEIADAMKGMQELLEQEASATLEELGFSLKSVTFN